MFDFSKELNHVVTVCDTDGNILYMNDKSKEIFAQGSDKLIGQNLKDCHKPASWEHIQEMIKTGGSNTYTISKNGKKKIVYQTVWRKDGVVAGMIEYSIEIPEDMPHFIR